MEPLLAFPHRLLGLLARGDVLNHREVVRAGVLFNLDRSHGQVDPHDRAIGTDKAFLHLESGYFPGIQPGHVIQIRLHVVRVGDAHPVETAHFLRRPTYNLQHT